MLRKVAIDPNPGLAVTDTREPPNAHSKLFLLPFGFQKISSDPVGSRRATKASVPPAFAA